VVPVQLFSNAGSFFQDGLGIVGIVPETVPGDLFFDVGQSLFFGSEVKDSP
jgi:hypothetical protein